MKKQTTLIEGNILPALIRFALPVLFALFLQSLYGGVDLLIVGRFADTANLSGVATGSMLMQTITMIITGLAMGITILVGQKIGEDKKEEAGQVIGSGILLFAGIAVIMTVLLLCFSGKLAGLLHAPKEAFDETSLYIRLCGLGSIFIIAYNVLGAIFRGIGDSKTPLFTVCVSCALNIIGDYIFVAIFQLGAAGAAIATVISQGCSVLISMGVIRRRALPVPFGKEYLKVDLGFLKKELYLGIPIALQELLVGLSFLVIQAIVNGIGVNESAGVGVAEKVCGFIMLVPSAYMQSMAAFVAQNNGAGRKDRSKKALLYGVTTSFMIGVVMFYLAYFHGDLLAGLFAKDPVVIQAAHEYLKAYGIDCLLTAILFCMIGYFNGCGNTVFVMCQGLFGAIGIRVPVSFLMSRLPQTSLFLIGLATPCSSTIQILLCVFMLLKLKKNSDAVGTRQ